MKHSTPKTHRSTSRGSSQQEATASPWSKALQRAGALLAACLAVASISLTHASPAWGTLNNFDCINDTGVPCHGFEIEVDDAHSTDITYTYDYNHYGTPKITEDNSDPLHPKVFIRYASALKVDGTWAAYTSTPTVPIVPTDGHCCTNPSLNEGCEHFGVGFYGNPTTVKYHWLIDDGAGNLVYGPPVNIATPTFAYSPPVAAVPAQVQAAIVPPEPVEVPVKEFGDATWVKEIRTSTHNANKVALKDLVSDDPADPNRKNWKNGEPAEVEVEWQILQKDYGAPDGGANGELLGAPEPLAQGDEVVTRRYEFYKYVGPLDPETGEALAENVAADGIHGVGTKTVNGVVYDLANTIVIGDYIGAQMAGFDIASPLGLIDHLQSGEVDVPYVDRTLVVGGNSPYLAGVTAGSLPDGLTFDPVTGVLSGTPTTEGVYGFSIEATDADNVTVTKAYNLIIKPAGGAAFPDPVISDVQVSNVTSTSATISWITDQESTSQVQLGADPGVLDANLATAHSVTLTGLSPATEYHFVVLSMNFAGSVAASQDATFTTLVYSRTNATIKTVAATYVILSPGLLPSDRVYYPVDAANITYTGGTTKFAAGELVDFTATADATGAYHALTMVVKPVPKPLVVNPSSLAKATIGTAYSVTVSGSGGVAPYTLGVTGLPDGLSFNGTKIVGTPVVIGVFPVVLSATDARGVTKTRSVSLTVARKAISFSPTLKAGKVSVPYSTTLSATGGYGALTFSASGLPPGLELSGKVISGVPTTAGTYSVTLVVTDSIGTTTTRVVSMLVNPGTASYTVADEGLGTITAVGPGFIKVGTKYILYDAHTALLLNDVPTIEVGYLAQWRGLKDKVTGYVLADSLEIN